MPSSTGNQKTLPVVLENGPGNFPDAGQLMQNFDALNDKNYICTEATVPASPYIGQEIFVTDCDVTIAKRIFTSAGWKAIQLLDIA